MHQALGLYLGVKRKQALASGGHAGFSSCEGSAQLPMAQVPPG